MIKCTLCESNVKANILFEINNVFASNVLFDYKDYDELVKNTNIKYARGECCISLCQCPNCRFIFNSKFNLDKMISAYSSDEYCQQRNFTNQLNQHIVNTGKKILSYLKDGKNACIAEIASGQGDLLRFLSEYVDYIYSIDPSPISNAIKDIANIKHVQEFFNYDAMVKRIDKKINMIICRHVIEHINNPRDILKDIIKLLEDDGILYIEVPDMQEIIEHVRFCDIYHDHYGYYQKNTLINILQELGCEFLDRVTYFNGQHQGLFFRKKSNFNFLPLKIELYDNFLVREKLDKVIFSINQIMKQYKNIGIYGAGGNSNTFLNSVEFYNLGNIKKAFDKNEMKHGKFLQNTNIKIYEPSKENLSDIDCIIMVMPICEDVVFKQEIELFMKNGIFKGDVYKTADCSYLI
ncbi:TPA: methyltransferase domain-containing protein [Campylobacter jejuni]|nr:methyltransferase domain-containing protein [Campylobacter jejuni]